MPIQYHNLIFFRFQDLSSEIESRVQLVAGYSGGDPFDESCSCIWATLADTFTDFPIPMACEAATIELRGEIQVYDDLAQRDAAALFKFFQRRGYINLEPGSTLGPVPALLRDATPLTAVEMVEAPIAGVIAWKVDIGHTVNAGDVLGEIVDIVNIDSPRYLLRSRTSGVVYGMRNHKLIRPGEIIIKIAGSEVLPWRTGKLLTA